MNLTLNLQTTGYGASIYQRPPDELDIALRGVKAEPQLVLNGLRYYLADDLKKAVGWLAQHDAEHASRVAEEKHAAEEARAAR